MSVVANLAADRLDPAAELSLLLADSGGDGAVVSFVGVARPNSKSGQPVRQLALEHHPSLTLRSLEAIGADAASRFEVSHLRIVHRFGELRPGEPIVFAGAASRHRRVAFEAADYLMDRLKTEAIFWKREETSAGSDWIEPSEADYADRGRWE